MSAVLLAGGASSRMGRDKAGVRWGGQPLWERQIATLRGLEPRELFISGRLDGLYADSDVVVVPDLTPGKGPLSGLEAAFAHAAFPYIVVLAIDLPAMTTGYLDGLVRIAAEKQQGVVPRLDGWFEPLAAAYPRDCLPLVRECLASDDWSMQRFVSEAVARGLVSVRNVTKAEAPLFRNVNTPEDLNNG